MVPKSRATTRLSLTLLGVFIFLVDVESLFRVMGLVGIRVCVDGIGWLLFLEMHVAVSRCRFGVIYVHTLKTITMLEVDISHTFAADSVYQALF